MTAAVQCAAQLMTLGRLCARKTIVNVDCALTPQHCRRFTSKQLVRASKKAEKDEKAEKLKVPWAHAGAV